MLSEFKANFSLTSTQHFLKLNSHPQILTIFHWFFFFKCRNGDLTACRLYGLFVCVLFVLQKSSWMQEKNKTISKPFLHFNLIDLFHYILDETFNFLFKVLNHFNISSFIWKKKCLKIFRFKRGRAERCFLSEESKFNTHWFAKFGLSIQYLLLLGITSRTKREAEILSSFFSGNQKMKCTRLVTVCKESDLRDFNVVGTTLVQC